MAYIHRDFTGPAIQTYLRDVRFKNQIINNWPKKIINGVEVFGTLFKYQNGQGILKTKAHRKIYKLFGMNIKDMDKQVAAGDYKGLENAYLYLKPQRADSDLTITTEQIRKYISDNCPRIYPINKDVFNPIVYGPAVDPLVIPPLPINPLHPPYVKTDMNPDPYKDNKLWNYIDKDGDGVLEAESDLIPEPQWDANGWITAYLTYSPLSAENVSATVTDLEIVSKVFAADMDLIHFDEEDAHKLTFAALLDSGSALFERKATVVNKTIERRTTYTVATTNGGAPVQVGVPAESNFMKTAVVRFQFRRVESSNSSAATRVVSKIADEIKEINKNSKSPNRFANLKFRKNIDKTLRRMGLDGVSQQIFMMAIGIEPENGTSLNYAGHIRVDAFRAMKNSDAVKLIGKQLANGYTLKKTKWWKKALSFVIHIVVIVLIVFFPTFTPLWLSLGSMAQAQLAKYWASQGDYDAAIYAGKHAQYLATAARIYSGIATLGISEGMRAIANNSKTGKSIMEGIQIVGALYGGYKAYTASSGPTVPSGSSSQPAPATPSTGSGQTGTANTAVSPTAPNNPPAVGNMPVATPASFWSNINAIYVSGALGDLTAEMFGQLLYDGLKNGIIDAIGARPGSATVMGNMLEILNHSFALYMTVVDPQSDIQSKQHELDATEKELEELNASTPDTIDSINREVDDPFANIFDMSEKIQGIPDLMTEGRNRLLMNRFYQSGF